MHKFLVNLIAGILLSVCILSITPVNAEVNLPPSFFEYTINHNNNPSDGYFYMEPSNFDRRQGGGNQFSATMNNEGDVVWFFKDSRRLVPFFDLGKMIVRYQEGDIDDIMVMNIADYTVDAIVAPELYDGELSLDGHDFFLNEDGSQWYELREMVPFDMSSIYEGGDPDAVLRAFVFQKVDAEGNVVWEWHSIDYLDEIQILEADERYIDFTSSEIDYLHTNAIRETMDGNVIVSNRSMSEILKLKVGAGDGYEDGDIMWRFGGGLGNQFTFVGDQGDSMFFLQHDVVELENGNITVFDNGNFHEVPKTYIREYELDTDAMTATLIYKWTHPDSVVWSDHAGGTRKLANDNWVVGWGGVNEGGTSTVTEVNNDGDIEWDLTFDFIEDAAGSDYPESYRAFKSETIGVAANPYVCLDVDGNVGTITCNWFGNESDVASYNVYMGTEAEPNDLEGNTETGYLDVTFDFDTEFFIRIKAVDADGNEISDFSNIVTVSVMNAVGDDEANTRPNEFLLSQNYPNPF
ncbi:arylsulfotransferase family protein, partial [bacterium]|nr:arylsulfotransferase family protein [bacterium]